MNGDFVNCLTEYNKRQAGTVKSNDNLLKFQSVNGDLLITNDKDQNIRDDKSITILKSDLRGFTDIIMLAQDFAKYIH